MRTALCLALLTACPNTPYTGDMCSLTSQTSQCGTEDVCADNQECEPASDVAMVQVTWTVDGMAASATTCANVPSLVLEFEAEEGDDTVGFSNPVSCSDGMFTATKLPKQYDQASMLNDETQQVLGSASIVSGTASIDLP